MRLNKKLVSLTLTVLLILTSLYYSHSVLGSTNDTSNSTTDVIETPTPIFTPTPVTLPPVHPFELSGWYFIQNASTGQYLQVSDNIGADGQNVETGPPTYADGQKWYIENLNQRSIKLKSRLGDFYLDLSTDSFKSEANVQISESNKANARTFQVFEVHPYQIYCIGDSNGLNGLGIGVSTKNDTNVKIQEFHFDFQNAWSFRPVKDVSFNYQIVDDWGSTYESKLVLTNNSDQTYSNWSLDFTLNSPITSLWGATLYDQEENTITIRSNSWDKPVAPGDSVTIHIIASGADRSAPSEYFFH